MIEQVFKDSVGQEVRIGDTIAYTIVGYSWMTKGIVESFTPKGYVRLKDIAGPKQTFVKIFNQ